MPAVDVRLILLVITENLLTKCQNVLESIQIKNFLARLVEEGVGVAVDDGAVSVLADEGPVEVAPPAGQLHVFEVYVLARVRSVAPDDARWQNTTLRCHISQRNISYVDIWLRFAFLEWIGHATWASAVRFFHLLGSDVDAVPDGVVDLNVFIQNVCDLSSASTRIGLDIDGLHGIRKRHILERDSPDARMRSLWRNRANRGTDTEVDGHVFDVDVLGAAVPRQDTVVA